VIAYEDLPTGRVIELGSTVVDRDEMLAFATRFDPQPFHLDEEAAKDSLLGGLCASGWYTMCLWMRAYADTVLAGSTSQGSPGGREILWPAPVFPGDKLDFSLEVTSARRSKSRPNLGLVEFRAQVDRDGQPVLRSTFTGMFGTRP
jgi:acyl dehydratase